MPRVLRDLFSFEGMKARWDSDNPNEPYVRKTGLPSWYDLDTWIIRVNDDDKTISTTGWKEFPEFVLVGGTKSIKDSERGHMADLKNRREQVISNKPLVAGFVDAENWLKANRDVGWQIDRYGIDEEVLQSIPEDMLNKLRDYYKTGAWGILPSGSKVGKSWQRIFEKQEISNWKNILKISGRTDDGREIDTDPETIRDYLTYRSWAWQSDKARKEEGLSGEGFNDKEHLELITTPRGRALGYSPKGRELKNWLLTWNKEFGERLGAIYPTGDE